MTLHNSNSASWIVFYFFLFTNKRDEGLTGDCKSVYVLKTLCNYKNRVPKVIAPLYYKPAHLYVRFSQDEMKTSTGDVRRTNNIHISDP